MKCSKCVKCENTFFLSQSLSFFARWSVPNVWTLFLSQSITFFGKMKFYKCVKCENTSFSHKVYLFCKKCEMWDYSYFFKMMCSKCVQLDWNLEISSALSEIPLSFASSRKLLIEISPICSSEKIHQNCFQNLKK